MEPKLPPELQIEIPSKSLLYASFPRFLVLLLACAPLLCPKVHWGSSHLLQLLQIVQCTNLVFLLDDLGGELPHLILPYFQSLFKIPLLLPYSQLLLFQLNFKFLF